MKIWTATDVESVLGECTRAVALIDKLVQTTSSEPAEGVIAWGQYLDLEHGANQQWGLYGTAAGAQILALKARAGGQRPSQQSQVAGALRLLPEDPEQGHELLNAKRDKDDFDNVLKLAAIAEALQPDSEKISIDNEPAIVARLREQALADGGWTTRPQGAEQREIRERDLATAYILHAWSRYELGEEGLKARRWLAGAILEGVPIEGNDLLALAGLAMTAHPIDHNDPPRVKEAIAAVSDRLVSWASSHEEIRVDRPMFSGFSVGSTTDYLFLHPEILTALFFVRQGNPADTRAFVIEVADALSTNIKANEGLKVSNGLKATVDQLWAFRFLYELRHLAEDGLATVAPPAGERQVRERARGLWRAGGVGLGKAVRLSFSKEAGYRRQATKGLLVLVPLIVALLAALLLFKHPAEGLASVVIGLCVAVTVGYFFFFKGRKTNE